MLRQGPRSLFLPTLQQELPWQGAGPNSSPCSPPGCPGGLPPVAAHRSPGAFPGHSSGQPGGQPSAGARPSTALHRPLVAGPRRHRAGASFLSATSACQPARLLPLHPRRGLASPSGSLEGVPPPAGGQRLTPQLLTRGRERGSLGGAGAGPRRDGRGQAGTRGSPGARGPSTRERTR